MVKIAGSEYLNIRDVQQMFKVSRTTVNNWRNKGILKTTIIGFKVYFKPEDVAMLIKKEN